MSHVLVTGANGFVGRALSRALIGDGQTVTGIARQPDSCEAGVDEWINTSTDFVNLAKAWPPTLKPDCVIHLAARVHVLHEDTADPEAAFRATNVEGALRVAETAHQFGVRRMVFVSSIKAVGERDSGYPLREDDLPSPQDAYGRSKLEAEQVLVRYGRETGLEVVIIRPPLVYGPEVRANFLRLLDGVCKGVPLPLSAIRARRSLVYIDNLVDALVRCSTDPRAAGQCFHVADGNDLTVSELARAIGKHLESPARLFPVPVSWLQMVGRVTHRSPQIDRLIQSLQVDTSRIRSVLGWQPRYSTDDGLAATARWYRSTH
ncbi:UDP-glucose 4-epimerase family protein [Paraburkholderia megapolitana]|uniref:UDP-glucose 4-epimerase family protein n=1 Tax=Paraburkholderia megapolitana TaxID=420953 RepID=UPI0038BB95BA